MYQKASYCIEDEGIVKTLNFIYNMVKQRICPQCGKLHTYNCKYNYCEKHYNQIRKYGHFLDDSSRSIYDSNEYRIEGDITYISVYNKQGIKLNQEVIIDTKNIPLILKYKVYIRIYKKDNLQYAYCNIARNTKLAIHKMLLPSIYTIDHINGNTLDNREENLREVNMTVQNLNKITTKGIQLCIHKGTIKGYAATMGYKNKRYISKYYKTEAEAKYYRYLMLQLLPFKVNYDLSFLETITEEQKHIINKDFINRFKNRVL